MNFYKSLICCLLFWFCAIALKAQCPDFLDLYGPNVTAYSGLTWDPISNVGVISGRHTLITQQGTDPQTGGLLPLLPPGESAVIKLGNECIGAQAESLVYTFTVDPDQPIVILKYAVVLEDPHHPSEIHPRFTIQMLNEQNELLADCMKYDVIAAHNIPGFQTTGNTRWRPWTINAFDLSEYIGQTVKLQVTTFDCGAGAHYGYAYFTASCISNHLAISGCNGTQVTLSAPSGFESYLWNNGTSSSSAVYTIQDNTIVTCSIYTVTDCHVVLSATFLSQDIPTQDQTFYDTICQGDSYQNHGFVLPSQTNSGDIAVLNTYFDINNCTESATNILHLHIIPRYTHIYDVKCEGDDYNEYGFVYQNLPAGQLIDTLDFVVSPGCDSSSILHLTVNPGTSPSLAINGPTELCSRNQALFILQSSENLSHVDWDVPEGVYVLAGNGTSTANIYFTQDAPNPSDIDLTVVTGCATMNTSLSVSVFPSYQDIYIDTICRGSEYNQHGFQLDVLDSVGLFVYTQLDTTTLGCDSITILQLFVADTPSVSAVPDPAVLCVGNETIIHALTPNASVTLNADLPSVHVCDILCTDSTFVHPQNWPCGKTPKAVVFYVDTSGKHGWAVDLHDANPCAWASGYTGALEMNIPDLADCPHPSAAICDHNGYQNTLHIRNYNTAQYNPAAYAVDFEDGWYLPAAGQAYHLYIAIPHINNSLQMVGGTPFPPNQWAYWTSSEINTIWSWVLDSNLGLYYKEKSYTASVRGVRSF